MEKNLCDENEFTLGSVANAAAAARPEDDWWFFISFSSDSQRKGRRTGAERWSRDRLGSVACEFERRAKGERDVDAHI